MELPRPCRLEPCSDHHDMPERILTTENEVFVLRKTVEMHETLHQLHIDAAVQRNFDTIAGIEHHKSFNTLYVIQEAHHFLTRLRRHVELRSSVGRGESVASADYCHASRFATAKK